MNDFVANRWVIETAKALIYAVLEYVQDDVKLRQKPGIDASCNWTAMEISPNVPNTSSWILTMSCHVNSP